MRRVQRFLLFFLLLMLVLIFTVSVSAEDTATQEADAVLTAEPLVPYTEALGGVRSIYSVNRGAVAALEAKGYTVVYGAVMARGDKDGVSINTAKSLSVHGNASEGYTVNNSHAAIVVVYATGNRGYVTGRYLDESKSSFAFTTAHKAADSGAYSSKMVYVGFVAVTDKSGKQSIVYDYAEEISALSLADRFVNDYRESGIGAYHYNQNAVLRDLLSACGKSVKTLAPPATPLNVEEPFFLSKNAPFNYLNQARDAYVRPEYADYETSIISSYSTKAADYNDRPYPATLRFLIEEAYGKAEYTVTLATDEALTENVRTLMTSADFIQIYNLMTGTTYYYRITASSSDGYSYDTPVSSFRTADTVRWIYVDGVRNVRDLGGWNGLNQGLIYRGSELNPVGTHGLSLTEEGRRVMVEELSIRTDLDFRAADQNGHYGSASPIGPTAVWKNHPIGNFMSAFGDSYTEVVRTFANYDNYPIYMHCWGGADRTGTVAFLIAGVCGASEADLAIDLEQTSFSSFGYRYRYDNATFLYASMLEKVKKYAGDTLKEKLETCFREVYHLSEAEISNIQAINTQKGAVYDFARMDREDILLFERESYEFVFRFVMRESESVSSVRVDGLSLPFAFDPSAATLTVDGSALTQEDFYGGIGEIAFDDGAVLRFYVEGKDTPEIIAGVSDGHAENLFVGATVESEGGSLLITPDGDFEIPLALSRAFSRAGYRAVKCTLTRGVEITVWNGRGERISSERVDETRSVTLPFGDCRICFSASAKFVMADSFMLVTGEQSLADDIMAGDYKEFFGIGTNVTEGETHSLHVTAENFIVSSSTVRKITDMGYRYMTFTAEILFSSGTEGCALAIRHGGDRYEHLYSALTAKDGHIKVRVTVALDGTTDLQLITRACFIDNMGYVVVGSGYTQVLSSSFVISELVFEKEGSAGAASLP